MLKQQAVPTSLGQLTVTSLTLGELRQLDSVFVALADKTTQGLSALLQCLQIIFTSVHKVHQDVTLDVLENGLTLEDFNALLIAVLDVSGLKKATAGEATPVTV